MVRTAKRDSAFVPPMGTQDFTSSAASGTAHVSNSATGNPETKPQKYYDKMRIYEPEVVTKYGMVTYFDYDEALMKILSANCLSNNQILQIRAGIFQAANIPVWPDLRSRCNFELIFDVGIRFVEL